jgi:hypothetical protein
VNGLDSVEVHVGKAAGGLPQDHADILGPSIEPLVRVGFGDPPVLPLLAEGLLFLCGIGTTAQPRPIYSRAISSVVMRHPAKAGCRARQPRV